MTERLEHPSGVGEGESASGHGHRRAGAHAVEELGLGGPEALERTLQRSSRAGRLHYFVVLDQQGREGESLIDASQANEGMDRRVTPRGLVAGQSWAEG